MIMNCKMVFTFFMLFLATVPFKISGLTSCVLLRPPCLCPEEGRLRDHHGGRIPASCDLVWYKGGSQFNSARVHTGFKQGIARLINDFASACGVKVYVTSSFRKHGVPIHGGVVPPAKRSNHFVGHAIDMNLVEGSDWCNSKCLRNPPARLKGVRCFIRKIRNDGSLRWGGDFRVKDPVHIDDKLNWRYPSLYNKLYKELQTNCA